MHVYVKFPSPSTTSKTSGPHFVRSRVSESGGLLVMQEVLVLYRLSSLYFDRLSQAHTLIDLLMFAPSVGEGRLKITLKLQWLTFRHCEFKGGDA